MAIRKKTENDRKGKSKRRNSIVGGEKILRRSDVLSIMCDFCFKFKHFIYSAANLNRLEKKGWSDFGNYILCPECIKALKERNSPNRLFGRAKDTVNPINGWYYLSYVGTVLEKRREKSRRKTRFAKKRRNVNERIKNNERIADF